MPAGVLGGGVHPAPTTDPPPAVSWVSICRTESRCACTRSLSSAPTRAWKLVSSPVTWSRMLLRRASSELTCWGVALAPANSVVNRRYGLVSALFFTLPARHDVDDDPGITQ